GALDATGQPDERMLQLGLLCNDAVVDGGVVVGGNPLDQALWESAGTASGLVAGHRRLAARPFDYQRRFGMALVAGPGDERTVVVKGAPEVVLPGCTGAPPAAQHVLDGLFETGSRVVAVASAPGGGDTLGSDLPRGLRLQGFLTFSDPPKPDAADALARLRALDVQVKVIT